MSENTQVRSINPDGSLNIFRNQSALSPWYTDLSHRILSMGWRKFFVSLGLVYIGVNIFFAFIYFALGPEGLQGTRFKSGWDFLIECFFFSVQTFSTIGYGQISPVGLAQNIVVSIQALTGMLSVGLMSGLFFTRFLKPTSKVKYADMALITVYDGKPAFIFRMANARQNQIVEANVSVLVLSDKITSEGTKMRVLVDLPLMRSRSTVFALSWMVIHFIDEKSPLHGLNKQDMQDRSMEIVVNVTGYDETFSNTVHSRRSYIADELEFDRNYEDMMVRKDGKIALQIEKISQLKPI